MADQKISDMTSGGGILDTDAVPVVRAGANLKAFAGTAAALDVGTSVGDVVGLINVGGGPGLPGIDGSQLTNLPGNVKLANGNPNGADSVSNTETALYSYTVPANTLTSNGDCFVAVVNGLLINSSGTATRQLRGKFSGTTFYDSGAGLVGANVPYKLEFAIIKRTGSAARWMATITALDVFGSFNSSTQVGTITGLDFTNPILFEFTGEAGGTGFASGDISVWFGRSYTEIT